jgi:hypothetical protein
MKKLIFFMTFLIFTRIGMGLGISAAPIGIGNFFLGAPSITESNLNQVLGLLVGADGQPGPAGVSGANGLNGINGLPGVPGAQGLPGAQGVKGDPGAPGIAGPPGVAGAPGKDGGVGSVGLGGGEVSIGTCDSTVSISATQTFTPNGFKLATVTVSDINVNAADAVNCNRFKATIHLTKKTGESYSCIQTITASSVEFIISSGACAAIPTLLMNELGDKIGLEFTEPARI